MCPFPVQRRVLAVLILLAAALTLPTGANAQQRAPEEESFEAARAQTEPAARTLALEHFLELYPAGARTAAAQQLLLNTYLANDPGNVTKIHTLASAEIEAVPAGFDRWTEQARIAGLLADAGDHGVDLPDARRWAQGAVDALTEDSFRREMSAAQARYKLPRLPAKALHAQFLEYRATFLAALAAVDLRQGQLDAAAPLLAEAFRLAPLSGEVNALAGELALAQAHPVDALRYFERADAMGHLAASWRQREVDLFEQQQHGDATALDRQLDAVYRTLYPPLFTLPPRQLPPGGHTVLLELFTGSGCAPCAAPDLALESLLSSYSRQDLAVLAYDEHIPRPDPLTTPDGVLRAASYEVTSTPAAFLDGEPTDVLGASRADVENVVVGFADALEETAQRPSGLQISLAVQRTPDHRVVVHPSIALHSLKAEEAALSTGDTSLRKLSQAVLHVALVEDNVRFSGENGIRVHRMVERSLEHLAAASCLNTTSQGVTFDLASLDARQAAYLSSYEATNDRFGTFHFAQKSFPVQGAELAIVAWVQDPLTRHVLQAAYAPVPAR